MTIKNLTLRIEEMKRTNRKVSQMQRDHLKGHTVHESPEEMEERVSSELDHLLYCQKVRKEEKVFLAKLDTVINTIKNA